MKIHDLEIGAMESPDDVVQFLKGLEVQQGDVLRVLIDQGRRSSIFKRIRG